MLKLVVQIKVGYVAVLIIALPIFFLVGFASGTKNMEQINVGDLTPHDRVVITNNSEFITQGWNGSGTAQDPFLIENLQIACGSETGIIIRNTSAYFVIRNCRISVGPQDDSPILIEITNSSHATIDGCFLISESKNEIVYGIICNEVANCRITNNEIDSEAGILIVCGSNVTVSGNTIHGQYIGLDIVFSQEIDVIANSIVGAKQGIGYTFANRSNIKSNSVMDCGDGLVIIASQLNIISGNCVYHNSQKGILLIDNTHNCSIIDNQIIENWQGNAIDDGYGNLWNENTWGNYLGYGEYIIPGTAGSIDPSPKAYSKLIACIIFLIIIETVVVIIVIYLLVKGHLGITSYIFGAVSFVLAGISWILWEPLPTVFQLSGILAEYAIIAIGAIEIQIDKVTMKQRSKAISSTFVVMTLSTFLVVNYFFGIELQGGLVSSEAVLGTMTIAALIALMYQILALSKEFNIPLKDTPKWIHERLVLWNHEENASSTSTQPVQNSDGSIIIRGTSVILIPMFGIAMGMFDTMMGMMGVLVPVLVAIQVVRDIRKWWSKKSMVLPFEEASLFQETREEFLPAKLFDAAAVATAALFASAYLAMWQGGTLKGPMYIINYLILILFGFVHISQLKTISLADTITHRINDRAYLGLSTMFLITLAYSTLNQFLSGFVGNYSFFLIIAIWLGFLAFTLVNMYPIKTTTDVRFANRAGIHMVLSLMSTYEIQYSKGIGPLAIEILLVITSLFIIPIVLMPNIKSLTLMIVITSLLCVDGYLLSNRLDIPIIFAIVGLVFIIEMMRVVSWSNIRKELFSKNPLMKQIIFMALEGPVTIAMVQQKLSIESEEAREFLKELKGSGLFDVQGSERNPEYIISSRYYRKNIEHELELMQKSESGDPLTEVS